MRPGPVSDPAGTGPGRAWWAAPTGYRGLVAMRGLDPLRGTADNYRQWAREAGGLSPAYAALAGAVAGDTGVLGFLAALPPPKRQPNLLFAAARFLLGSPAQIADLRALVRDRPADLAGLILARRTQTNEPARCATILPALAQLPEPLALIEVGASAGLTLLFDHYSYDYGGVFLAGRDPDAPVLRCAAYGPVPVPARIPVISWRAGLDLNPLDVTSDDDVRWLSCLLWPGEPGREERLAAAVASARREPPQVRAGDLTTDLPALAAQAPADATLVVFHSAVLAYVTARGRAQFADAVRDCGAVWLSNEAPGVIPGVPVPRDYPGPGPFLLIRDGRTALASTEGHGSWVRWADEAR